jgi:hypothetical protein
MVAEDQHRVQGTEAEHDEDVSGLDLIQQLLQQQPTSSLGSGPLKASNSANIRVSTPPQTPQTPTPLPAPPGAGAASKGRDGLAGRAPVRIDTNDVGLRTGTISP